MPSIDLLNGLTTPDAGWHLRYSHRFHTDHYGQRIAAGERHYVRNLKAGKIGDFDAIRLSMRSMELLLEAVFLMNHVGTELAMTIQHGRKVDRGRLMFAAMRSLERRQPSGTGKQVDHLTA